MRKANRLNAQYDCPLFCMAIHHSRKPNKKFQRHEKCSANAATSVATYMWRLLEENSYSNDAMSESRANHDELGRRHPKSEEKTFMAHITRRMLHVIIAIAVLGLASLGVPDQVSGQLTFDVFVDPHAVVSGGTIGFTFAGDKFVGSVQGDGVGILYQTDLHGGNLKLFAPEMNVPSGNFASEHCIASSPGLGGFPLWDIYVGAGTGVLHISHDGAKSDLFVNGLKGPVQSIRFDTVGTFGHDMLVGTYFGTVYRINSAGIPTLLADFSELVEGMDVAPLGAGFGPFNGKLIVVSETWGLVRAISPTGGYTILNQNNPIPTPESISFVPGDLGASGSSVEGFYESNYYSNVVKANASQFASLKGDAIITSELGVRTIWRMHWNGLGFDITKIGDTPDQAEEGLFVTPAMLSGNVCPPTRPSPPEWCEPFCKDGQKKWPRTVQEH